MSTLVLSLIVLGAFTAEAAAGFGSIIVAVTLGALVMPLPEVIALVVPLNLLLTAYIVARYRAHIAWGVLLRRALPLLVIGVALGQLAFAAAGSAELEHGLGVLVIVVSLRELWRLWRGTGAKAPLSPVASALWLLAGGVVHGVYATGGPFVVYVLGRSPMPKLAFRSTLSTIWLVLNAALTVVFVSSGRLGPAQGTGLLLLVPAVVGAIFLGEWLHRRVDERRFRIAVFGLLTGAGALLAF